MEASTIPALLHRSQPPVASTRLVGCSDDQLVERFRDGRDEAFRVIHDRYRPRLLAYVRQMLAGRSAEDAEDVLQDVFERAARTLRSEGQPLGLRPWLYSVAHNRCIDELRRRPPAPPDVLAASRLPAGDTSTVAERRADVERLFRDLGALPELQRSALLMRELQGLSHAEVAQALEATVPAVKSLLVRARTGLAEAEGARAVACSTIRDDLAATHGRRVKASAQAARHLRECTTCRSYRAELRRGTRRLSGLIPGPTFFPLAALSRLLGGGAQAAKAPAAASALAGGGAGAGKLLAVLGAATAVTTGAVIERGALPWSAPSPAHHAVQRSSGSGASATPGGAETVAGAHRRAAAAPPSTLTRTPTGARGAARPTRPLRAPGGPVAPAAGGLPAPAAGTSPAPAVGLGVGGPATAAPGAAQNPLAGIDPDGVAAAGTNVATGVGSAVPADPSAVSPTDPQPSAAAGPSAGDGQPAAGGLPVVGGVGSAVAGAPAKLEQTASDGAAGSIPGSGGGSSPVHGPVEPVAATVGHLVP